MSIRQQIEQHIESCGLFADEATAVMTRLEASELGEPMKGRWDEDVAAYPPGMMAVAITYAKSVAVAYIDETCPEHWARPMLAN